VMYRGDVLQLQGYGLANLEHDVRVTPDTVFDLASVTKSFTAAAIMLLVEEERVRLDDRIARYLPKAPAKWNTITVRHRLTHTSGLPGMGEGAFRDRANLLDDTTEGAFDAAAKDDLSFEPGRGWKYSDAGYFLLGMIIENRSGRPYRDFLQKRFFEPLGM